MQMNTSSEGLQSILEIVQNTPETEYQNVIVERKDYEVMYHLSPVRSNLLSWLPIGETDRVLEVNAECGAYSGTLAELAAEVVCIEHDAQMCEINRARNKGRENLSYRIGGIDALTDADREAYDWIIVNGEDLEKIAELRSYLKIDGTLVLAVSNLFGEKYWAGALRDPAACSRKHFEKLLEESGYTDTRMYYPYPDHLFPMMIHSDAFLPSPGELHHNRRNFGEMRYEYFDETGAFDRILKEDMYGAYANSYLILAGGRERKKRERETIFVKYSDERSPEFAVRTDVLTDHKGKRYVEKTALSPAGTSHLQHIEDCYRKLSERYRNSGLLVNVCSRDDKGLSLAYVEGRSLADAFKHSIQQGRKEEAEDFLQKYIRYVMLGETDPAERKEFVMTEQFREVFGDVTLPEHLQAGCGLDIDMIFPNLILDENGWNLLDYEWTFDFPIPYHYVIYRALFYESLEQDEKEFVLDEWLDRAGITAAEVSAYGQMELSFQQYSRRGIVPTRDMQKLIGYPVISVPDMEHQIEDLKKEIHEISEKLYAKSVEAQQYQNQIAAMEQTKLWRIRTKVRSLITGRT